MRAPDTAAPAVVVEGVSKTFHMPAEQAHTLKERVLRARQLRGGSSFVALQDVTFSVEQGEFFGIVGRNGSGKSTLLKCLAGIYRADGGRMLAAGRIATFIELGVGFNPDLAARDNVVLNATMLGLSPAVARSRFDDIIAFAELEDFIDLKLKNYSSGMLVRLAFATAIQADADILLIDEVLAVGDAAFQQKCFDVFGRLQDEGRTILFVTHDMATVVRFCARAMLLDHGRLVAIGDPELVAEHYLRLNFPDDEEQAGSSRLRSGDGSATIEEAWTEDDGGGRRTTFLTTETCVFRARVAFAEDVEQPNFNVVWVNDHGHNVFAVSTAAEPGGSGTFRAGDVVDVRLSFVASLAPGNYQVTMVVSRPGSGLDFMDRWERMFSILVTSTTAAGGLVELPHELTIEPAATIELEHSS
ncbi:MAG: type transport system ATP-binding protein [Gaiellales bacterium]|jgi:ABC-type polysaccharide/polyol phosphate transport system ATPase subunit|nr:type transport system ATP-binding protein [Gaiellales bacterium]